jgi:uracil-DNA glycosylase
MSATPIPLRQLVSEVRHFTLCASTLPLGPSPVLQAHQAARVLVAGQAPGKRVHLSGIPFDDASGDRLRSWLGVDRQAFYDARAFAILPMGFCYPGTGKSGDLPPRPECAPMWRERLLAQLSNLDVTLVIGQYAMAYHLPSNRASLTDMVRASDVNVSKVIILPHPSPRNNIWLSRNRWFEADVVPVLQARVAAIFRPA